MKNELLTVEDLKTIEQTAMAGGFSEKVLMERAGEGVVEVILEKFAPCPTVIFCGVGKNGGDGKVVARLLKEKGWPVKVVKLDDFPSSEEIETLLYRAEL